MRRINLSNKRDLQFTLSAALLILVLLSTSLLAGPREIKVTDDKVDAAHSHFGWSVSLQNGIGFISAPHEDTETGKDAGAVYVYNNNNELMEKLVPAAGRAFDNFGYSVSHYGDVALVSAIGDGAKGPFSGAVYVFRYNGTNWIEEQKLTANDGRPGSMFGCSVSVKGNIALIGARQASGNAAKSGAAYIFSFDGLVWNQDAKLIAADGAEGDFFGHSVSISEDGTAAIGAYGNTGGAAKSGAAYIFTKTGDGWTQLTKLTAEDGTSRDLFGFSISICDEHLVVGAYQNKNDNKHHGAAYVFSKAGNDWIQSAKLIPADGRTHDYFGISVAVSQSTVLVGASRTEKDDLIDVGAVYVFTQESGNWVNANILRPENGMSNDQYGLSVAIEEEVSLIGSRLNDNDEIDSGSAYFVSNSLTDVEDEIQLPIEFALFQNYPNPFNPTTIIKYSIPSSGFVSLKVFDVLGNEVNTLVSEFQNSGYYNYNFNAAHLASGIYFYRLKVDNRISRTKKMILMR